MNENTQRRPFVLITEHYLRVGNPPYACDLYSNSVLNKNDPVLEIAAEQLHMTTQELVDLLRLFFKYFPEACEL